MADLSKNAKQGVLVGSRDVSDDLSGDVLLFWRGSGGSLAFRVYIVGPVVVIAHLECDGCCGWAHESSVRERWLILVDPHLREQVLTHAWVGASALA